MCHQKSSLNTIDGGSGGTHGAISLLPKIQASVDEKPKTETAAKPVGGKDTLWKVVKSRRKPDPKSGGTQNLGSSPIDPKDSEEKYELRGTPPLKAQIGPTQTECAGEPDLSDEVSDE